MRSILPVKTNNGLHEVSTTHSESEQEPIFEQRVKQEPQPGINVEADEKIARFITSTSHVAKSKGRIKYGAFMPAPDGETSVYRVSGITKKDTSDIGENFVRKPRIQRDGTCTIHGWAELKADIIFNQTELYIQPAPYPHPRHANLTSWPSEKPKQQQFATALANSAKYQFADIIFIVLENEKTQVVQSMRMMLSIKSHCKFQYYDTV